MRSNLPLPVAQSKRGFRVPHPRPREPCPAIVLMHHRGGLDTFTSRSAMRLAENGFHVAAPHLYHRRPPGEDTGASRKSLTDADVLADIGAVVEHLRASREVRADAIAIMGHCMGGRMAYLGAASIPHVKAAVVLYGGGIRQGEGEGRPAPIELTKNIRGPVLGLFGQDDTNPSPADVEAIAAELKRPPLRHKFHSYGGARHRFP